MNQYLVRYRRSSGDLLHFEDLGSDRASAMDRRLMEECANKDDSDVEVVLLTASTREALLQTHARYFRTVPELAAALAAALPVINGDAAPSVARKKTAIAQHKP